MFIRISKYFLFICLACFFCSCSYNEKAACNLVTDLLKENFGEFFKAMDMETAECKAVELGKPVRSGFYPNAKAYLDNGKVLKITVETKWDSVYVHISNESLFDDD
ncbi:hypothetical protein [Fibrobacter intestinalis]|uniref:Lipoprotein n=1 Tax=Fibrobacter intestinalis TaxID=28122 RepID=A0A1T4PD42_9BACT|nr:MULTISPECIES: hypothetical protein [Fibrobacter]PBC75087.1 hypothetical protein BGW94_2770 [Fibrobacter sp. NR9]SJZ89116.1 hypothetical protein SAMN02745108_01874 [Fibrobacter intestinalis]